MTSGVSIRDVSGGERERESNPQGGAAGGQEKVLLSLH